MRVSPVAQSAVSSLKTIFAILMGLSVTNTLVVLIHKSRGSPITPLADLPTLPKVFAVVLLFTIVRFYLGNIRHVDDFYVTATVDGKPLDRSRNSAARFTGDFTVLIVEALLFGLASFYILHAANFTIIVILLLAVDIVWTVTARGVSPHQGFWFVNNAGHFILIAACYGFHIKYEASAIPFYFASGFLFTNGLADFVYNRAFYFADRKGEKAIFLSAPFTQLLENGRIPADVRESLDAVIDHLEAHDWSVANAHRREQWGAALDSPRRALLADLAAIETAGVLVAILGSPPSPGVQLEIGFALARGKGIILVADEDDPMPYLIRGVADRESVLLVHCAQACTGRRELVKVIAKALKTVDA